MTDFFQKCLDRIEEQIALNARSLEFLENGLEGREGGGRFRHNNKDVTAKCMERLRAAQVQLEAARQIALGHQGS